MESEQLVESLQATFQKSNSEEVENLGVLSQTCEASSEETILETTKEEAKKSNEPPSAVPPPVATRLSASPKKTSQQLQVSTTPTSRDIDTPCDSTLVNKRKAMRKKRGHSEWLEKALEEGGKRRSRTSKRVSNPDFVFTDQIIIRDTSTTPCNGTTLSNALNATASVPPDTTVSPSTTFDTNEDSFSPLPDLDYANMNHHEKFYKYKKEYTAWMTKTSIDRKRGSSIGTSANSNSPECSSGDQKAPGYSTRQSPRVKKSDISSVAPLNKSSLTEENETNIQSIVESLVVLEKDKYCWFCHKEILETHEKPHVDEKTCKTCCKILHVRCDPNSTEGEGNEDQWECKHCTQYRKLKDNDLWAPYVEYLGYDKYIKQVRYIIDKLKKYPSTKEFLQPVNAEQFPDYRQYIAHPVDFQQIERRLKNGEYRSVDTLYEDFRWMFHNSVLYNGNSSGITKDLRVLLRNLRMDLYDLDSCACCYIHAYTRPDAWFILPCSSPHLLVWAQMKGFPYWPGKVYDSHIEQRPGEILVKFFGDHARSWIPLENIYLYSLDPPANCPSRKKKKHSMIPSLVEMDKHIELLKEQFGVFKYPEQDILIGTNTSERSLQLKYMLPSCTTTLPKAPCTIETHLPCSTKEDVNIIFESINGKPKRNIGVHIDEKNVISPMVGSGKESKPITRRSLAAKYEEKPSGGKFEPIFIDMNDASSKRIMLSRLEKRMQQCRSDSEDSSVKSFGKECSAKNESSGKPSEYSYKNNNKAARSVRCQMFFKVLKRKMKKVDRGKVVEKCVRKRKIVKSSVNSENSKANLSEKQLELINKDKSLAAKTREVNQSTCSKTVQDGPKITTIMKKNQPAEQEKVKDSEEIPTALKETQVENAVTNTSLNTPSNPPTKNPSCNDIDEFIETHLASTEQTGEWDQNKIPPILTRDKTDTENSESIIDEKNKDSNKNNNATATSNSTPTKVVHEIIDKLTSDTSNKILNELSDIEKDDANKENKIRKNRKVSRQKSLRLKRRLFRHKKYSAQLFEFRKLTLEMKKHSQEQISNEQKPSLEKPNPEAHIAKYFDSRDVKITNPSVILTSLTIEELKELKRNVKLSKNKGFSGLNVGKRLRSTESEFVPIEDTMRISMDSEDLNAFSCDSLESIPNTKPRSTRSNNRTFLKGLDHGRTSYNTEDASQGGDLRNWRTHMSALMKCLDSENSTCTTRRAESMLKDVKKLKELTEEAVGQDIPNHIAVDTQYSAALSAAELVLYSEYASEFNPPDLTEHDFDVEFSVDLI